MLLLLLSHLQWRWWWLSNRMWRAQWLNLSPPITAYMRRWTGSAFVQKMACCLFGAKPLSKPMLGYCQLPPPPPPPGQNKVKLQSKYKTLHSRKCIWKHRLWNGGHLVQGRWVNRVIFKFCVTNLFLGIWTQHWNEKREFLWHPHPLSKWLVHRSWTIIYIPSCVFRDELFLYISCQEFLVTSVSITSSTSGSISFRNQK